jgi:glyoxylase-like metal-dependent hydrolase (beta-lactamase superfamily II)
MICKQLSSDAWRIRFCIDGPLQWVNAYLFKGRDGYSVIDPGLNCQANMKRWDGITQSLMIRYSDIKHIFITHHHSDHYGLAGWLQERSQAEVWMSKLCRMEAEWAYRKGRNYVNNWLRRLGGDDSLSSHHHACEKHPQNVRYIMNGEMVHVGDRTMQAIFTPGHSRGHVSFYDKQGGLIICGDQILPYVMPNLTFINGIDGNPLSELFQSMGFQRQLKVKMAWPGHLYAFSNYLDRCLEIQQYHRTKLESVKKELSTGTQSPFDLCKKLYPTYADKPSLLLMKLSETYSYLQYLLSEREARWHFADNVIQFSACS